MSGITKAEEDLRNTLRYVQALFTVVGAWPFASKFWSQKFLQHFLIFTSYVLLLSNLIPGYTYMFLTVKNGRRRLKLLSPLLNSTFQMIKYTVILYRKEQFRETLDEIKRDYLSVTQEDRQIFRTKTKIGHRVVLLMAVTMYSSGLCYRTILPLSKGKIVLPNNTTMRFLPCPGNFFFIDEQVTPNYEIIFALQILSGFVTYTLVCSTAGVSALLCLHIAGLLRMLMNKMIELSKSLKVTEEIVQEKMVEIIDHQTRIKRFLSNVEEITQYNCFFEIANGTLIACIVGYCIILEWEDSNAAAFAIFFTLQTTCIISVFSVCYIGQLLINESNNVRETVVTLDWYRFPINKARFLVLIINMSNHPVKLTAAKMIDLSFATFTDIMKMSMAYLNMLREVV